MRLLFQQSCPGGRESEKKGTRLPGRALLSLEPGLGLGWGRHRRVPLAQGGGCGGSTPLCRERRDGACPWIPTASRPAPIAPGARPAPYLSASLA